MAVSTSIVSSVEASSATMISVSLKSISFISEHRHCQVNAALLKTGITIDVLIETTEPRRADAAVAIFCAALTRSAPLRVGGSNQCTLPCQDLGTGIPLAAAAPAALCKKSAGTRTTARANFAERAINTFKESFVDSDSFS